MWASIPAHTSRTVKLYCGSRAFGTNFHFLFVFVVSEKKFMVKDEDKPSRGVPRETKSEFDEDLNGKEKTGSELAASTPLLEHILRQDRAT